MTKKQIILTTKTGVAVAALLLTPSIFNHINPYVGVIYGILTLFFMISNAIKLAKTQ